MRALIALLLVLGACGSPDPAVDQLSSTEEELLLERLQVLSAHVTAWQEAPSIEELHASAESAANHLVGPEGPGFGDRDGDGQTFGPTDAGILPGAAGLPQGFALAAVAAGAPSCVDADLLGGSWDAPGDRWLDLEEAIELWSNQNNTFPGLASHAQRVVGWATLALRTDDLDEAKGYANHAHIHVRISLAALVDC